MPASGPGNYGKLPQRVPPRGCRLPFRSPSRASKRPAPILAALLWLALASGCGNDEPQSEAAREAAATPGAAAAPPVTDDPESPAHVDSLPSFDDRPAVTEVPPRQGPNRLIDEKSPYLLQHAHNPVDWYPWGEEAFARAQRDNKPIFLSVGYSTCHWCHVMAHESFEDPATAAVLNEHFVSIKLDREERPDIDRIYMSFVQATTGRGGWPLNVFLTPDRQPFLGGTYFPPRRAGDRPGFVEVLEIVAEKWRTDRSTLESSAALAVEQLRAQSELQQLSDDAHALSRDSMARAASQMKERFDAVNAGFGRAPKFPRPSELRFLHRQSVRTGEALLLDIAVATLDAIRRGGIHDQLAGGFHRYAVDAGWREPHFEKMLYDQGQLVVAFLEAYQLRGDENMAAAARSTLEYVLRDMRHAQGGFYSAEDADSAEDAAAPQHKTEGAFYVWPYDELQSVLSPELLELAEQYYGVVPDGNLFGGELRGKNALYIDEPLAAIADSLQRDVDTVRRQLQELHAALLERRRLRPRPHLDDKVLTSWNGLMISALAQAAQVLDEPRYAEAATQAAAFVQKNLWDARTQRLLRRWRLDDAAIDALNVDYAFLVQGLLDLYEATFDMAHLEWARELTERQIVLFADDEAGAFFDVADADSSLLFRTKEFYDGALPTSNSVTALNLLRLAEIGDVQAYRERARRLLEYYAVPLQDSPLALPSMLIALDWHLTSPQQIIIAGNAEAADTVQLMRAVRERFLPTSIVLLADGGAGQQRLASDLPVVASMGPIDGKAAAFVCENYACQLPVTDAAALGRQLDDTGSSEATD